MFSRRKTNKTEVNATNSYLVEVARATLKHELKTDVYLTQVKIMSSDMKEVEPWAKIHRPFTNAVRLFTVEVFFTSLDHPRRHGSEGSFPILPKATIHFLLTNEANGWHNWQILRIQGCFSDFYAPKPQGDFLFEFTDMHNPPENLRNLACELEHRRPTPFRNNE